MFKPWEFHTDLFPNFLWLLDINAGYYIKFYESTWEQNRTETQVLAATSVFKGSRVELHGADRAEQGVERSNGTENQVSFTKQNTETDKKKKPVNYLGLLTRVEAQTSNKHDRIKQIWANLRSRRSATSCGIKDKLPVFVLNYANQLLTLLDVRAVLILLTHFTGQQ